MSERYIEVEEGDRLIIYAVPKASPEAPPQPPDQTSDDLVLLHEGERRSTRTPGHVHPPE
jgi:hypothetical protein